LQESLLIALYAHVNEYALFYCPKARSFASGPAEYFFDPFRAQNAQLLEKDDGLRTKFEVFDNERTPEAVIGFMRVLSRRDEPVFYIIDEHNELFKRMRDTRSDYFPYEEPVVREFVNWNSAVEGNRTFTLYSGSAHSRFLSQLPGGESHRIRNIGLMTDEEFQTATKDKSSPFYFSDDSRRGELLRTIGKIPRHLFKIDDLTARQDDIRAEYQYRLDRWVEEEFARPHSRQGVLEFLEEAVFKTEFAAKFCRSSACNPGLICFGDEGIMYPVNGIAAKVLLEKWAQVCEVKPLSQYRDPGERGIAFERQICRAIISSKQITFSYMDITKMKHVVTWDLSHIQVVSGFASRRGEDMNIKGLNRYQENIDSEGTTLWIPRATVFPYIDFILDIKSSSNEERTLFVLQTSIKEGMHDGVTNFFKKHDDLLADKVDELKYNKQYELKMNQFKKELESLVSFWNLRNAFKLKEQEKLVYVLLDGSNSGKDDQVQLNLNANCEFWHVDAHQDDNPFKIRK
jgi:hypothetical protein